MAVGRDRRGPPHGALLALMARGNPDPDAGDMGPIVVSPETTRIVEPLTTDGMVDYAAALNAVEVPAATDNAAIPLIRILGTDALIGNTPDILAQLGAPPDLPPTASFVAAPDDVLDELMLTDECHEREGNALIAEWITDNRVSLDALVESSRRSRLWWPGFRDPENDTLTPALQLEPMRDLTDALATRAAIARADGDLQAAWAGVEALLRLHGLADQLPGLLSRMIAHSFHSEALDWLKHTFETPPPDLTLSSDILQSLRIASPFWLP